MSTSDKKASYDPLMPDLNNWPVVQLSRNRLDFRKQVEEEAKARIHESLQGSLRDELERALFRESIRMKEKRWSTDPKDESAFWQGIKDELIHTSKLAEANSSKEADEKALSEIVSRYAKEISGKFNISVYKFVQRLMPVGFYPLLKSPVNFNFLDNKVSAQVRKRIQFTGDIDKIRALSKDCTVVMVPTHFSNLDSVIAGWSIGTMGLPAFLYGAGQNLFGIKLFAFFMNYLGSYKVDRRKKNMLYLETLKTYSTLALSRGCHSLFFPGGRRSRSGSIETKLKLGLLGTAIDAQYRNLLLANAEAPAKKIIVVPVVINYHFVMEAPVLIDDYLKTTGKESYLIDEKDKYSSSYELFKIVFKLFTKGSEFSLSFGEPMDVFGNTVDNAGASFSHKQAPLNIRDYFVSHGELRHDRQRNTEYVRMLGEKITTSFKRENTVFSSHLVAFAAFEMLRRRFPKMDIYDLIRLSDDERVLPKQLFFDTVSVLYDAVRKMADAGTIRMAEHLLDECKGDIHKIIEHGVHNVGIYHSKKVLLLNKKGDITSEDLKLLYYYHNRLEGYSLAKYI